MAEKRTRGDDHDDKDASDSYEDVTAEESENERPAGPVAPPATRGVSRPMTASKSKAVKKEDRSSSDRGPRARGRDMTSPFSPPREEPARGLDSGASRVAASALRHR